MLRELLCCVITSLLGAPGGILLFTIIYHPLHDIYNIHSEITSCIILGLFILVTWSGDRKKKTTIPEYKIHWTTILVVLSLIIHYATFLIIILFYNPQDESVTGLREEIGPCDQYVPLRTVFGIVSELKILIRVINQSVMKTSITNV